MADTHNANRNYSGIPVNWNTAHFTFTNLCESDLEVGRILNEQKRCQNEKENVGSKNNDLEWQ